MGLCGIAFLAALTIGVPCTAWSPKVHSLQTKLAKGIIPRGMANFLDQHPAALLEANKKVGRLQAPTPEDVEQQFDKVVKISHDGKPPAEIVYELSVLANMVQLLTDPSVTGGLTHAQRTFSTFADEHFDMLAASKEPLFAAKGELNPKSAIHAWTHQKYDRYRLLTNHINPSTGEKIGTWDTLSVPFAQMQLGFSTGINATANIWIYAWRAVGAYWVK
jgi:hypothetical protein